MKLVIFALIALLAVSPLARAKNLSGPDFLEKINILFLKEDYTGLIKSATGDLAHYRLGRKEKKEVLYLTGLSYIKLGDFVKARKYFSDILKMGGSSKRQEAYIAIAGSYFNEKNFSKTIKAYKDILNKYPNSDRLSGVYYNLGLSYKAKKDSDKANFYFKKVVSIYGTSFEAKKITYLPTGKKDMRYYIVQLGAFRSLKNAKKMVRRLTRKKYDSYIQKVRKGGAILYRVRAGKFSNKYYAMRLQRKLRRSGFSVKIIEE